MKCPHGHDPTKTLCMDCVTAAGPPVMRSYTYRRNPVPPIPPFTYQQCPISREGPSPTDAYRIADGNDDRVATCFDPGHARRLTHLLNFALTGENILTFYRDQAEWSRLTFGQDYVRGPRGPLEHLVKEAKECLASLALLEHSPGNKEARNDFKMEAVDILFLLFDFTRRAGIGLPELVEAAFEKLHINKARKWNTPTPDAPVEHVRDGS